MDSWGRKLARSSPGSWNRWIHCVSLTSVLPPGTVVASWALTSTTSGPHASRIPETGIE